MEERLSAALRLLTATWPYVFPVHWADAKVARH